MANKTTFFTFLLILLASMSAIAGDEDVIFENSFEFIDLGAISYVTSETSVFDQAKALIDVRVTMANGALTDVMINGEDAVLISQDDEAAYYRQTVILSLGDNLVEAVAEYSDALGDRQERIEANFRYHELPVINFTSPTDWQTLGPIDGSDLIAGGALNLSGVVERPVNIIGTLSAPITDLVINQQQAEFTDNTFTFEDYFLHEGTNLISATATDQYGRQTTASITVYVDQTAPYVTMDNTFERITSANFITLNGTVNDAVEADFNAPEATVSINNLKTGQIYQAQVHGMNFLAPKVDLAVGENPLLIVASDQMGNARQINTRITRVTGGNNRLSYLGGSIQRAPVNSPLAQPMRIAAFDGAGLPLSGVDIRFDVIKGSGTISSSATFQDVIDGVNLARNLIIDTGDSGEAEVWLTHGQESGLASHVVKAWSDDLSEAVYFTTSSLVGEPVRVVIEDGAGTQYAQTHAQPLHAPTVVVLDAQSNPVPEAQVRFSIRSGDAQFDATSAPNAQISNEGLAVVTVADKNGQASARPKLGSSTGVVLMEAQALNSSGNLVGSTNFQIIVKARNNGPTRFSGSVVDMSGIPLEGVTLSFARTGLTTTTNEAGFFKFEDNVPVGRVDLFIDGRDVTMVQNGETIEFPGLHFEATVIQGQDNHLPHFIYLPPIHTERAQVVGGAADVSLTIPGYDGFEMIVKANSVTFLDGSREGDLVVNPVHADRLPMVPPGGAGRFSPFGWTIQPTGTRFDPPIEVRMPNVDGMKPGTTRPIVQWDHDLAQFVPMGLGTVSADGTQIITEPGSGITKAGWGGGPPPPPPSNEGENQECSTERGGGACDCSVSITADGNEDELFVGFDENSGNEIQFVATPEGDCGELIFAWQFGDGGVSNEFAPRHTYSNSGQFDVVLYVDCVECGFSLLPQRLKVVIFKIKMTMPVDEEEFLVNWSSAANVNQSYKIIVEAEPSGGSTDFEWEVTSSLGTVSANPDTDTSDVFDFDPDMTHPSYNNNGSQGGADASDAVDFEIKLSYDGSEVTKEIEQDEISIIRQEYVNHDVVIPDRGDFNVPVATTNFSLGELNITAYTNIAGDPGTMAESVRTEYNIGIQLQLGLQNPPDYGLQLTSTWRNPERNELVGGVLNSRHQYGNALDIRILGGTPNATGLTSAQLWQILRDAGSRVGTVSICERLGTQILCNDPTITHVHVQQ